MNRKRINPTLPEGADGNIWELFLADLRGHVFGAGEMKQLAEKAGLHEKTVSNIAYGITRYPQMLTVMKIMIALDKHRPVLEAFKSETPVSLKAAGMRKSARRKTFERNRSRENFSFKRASTKRSGAA